MKELSSNLFLIQGGIPAETVSCVVSTTIYRFSFSRPVDVAMYPEAPLIANIVSNMTLFG